jgi:hypothetical protein
MNSCNFIFNKARKFYACFLASAFISAASISGPAAFACSSSDYNYQTFFETQRVDCGGANYNPIFDSAVKFVNLSVNTVLAEQNASGGSGEVKVMIKKPFLFEPSLKFDPETINKTADSLETEISGNYKTYNVSVCGSAEVESVYKNLGFSAASDEVVIFTPEILKRIYSENGIYAVVDISFYSMSVAKHYQINIKTPASDRRDLARTDKFETRIRYKITKCETGDILWIDEVCGLSDDSFYYSLFEKGLMYNLKQVCINESALQ